MGDAKFSDSLELMTFLANLVGSGTHRALHSRWPTPTTERAIGPTRRAEMRRRPSPPPGPAASGTREMPKFIAATQREPPPSGTAQVARTERKADAPAKSAAPESRPTGPPPSSERPRPPTAMDPRKTRASR